MEGSVCDEETVVGGVADKEGLEGAGGGDGDGGGVVGLRASWTETNRIRGGDARSRGKCRLD